MKNDEYPRNDKYEVDDDGNALSLLAGFVTYYAMHASHHELVAPLVITCVYV